MNSKLREKIIKKIFYTFLFLIISVFLSPSRALARECQSISTQITDLIITNLLEITISDPSIKAGAYYHVQVNRSNLRILAPAQEDGKLVATLNSNIKPNKKYNVILEESCKDDLKANCPDICEGYFTLTPETKPTTQTAKDLCSFSSDCISCFDAGNTWTALGCIPTNNTNELLRWVFTRAIFFASGIAFLLMIFGAFQIITSAGNPEKVQAGKELITSCVSGLLFIILSLFLLKLIGVDILHIPGFGE